MQHLYKHNADWGGLLYVWFQAMHTRIDLALCGAQDQDYLLATARRVQAMVQYLEQTANCFDPASELARLNGTPPGRWRAVSPELFTLITLCVQAYRRSGGYFDITVHSMPHTPHTFQALELDEAAQNIRFGHLGMKLNLSGFLKGYALDRARAILEQQGVENALLSMGGSSVLALGDHPHGRGWKVGFGPLGLSGDEVLLHNECLTTSGNETPARRHIIDPRTGLLVQGCRTVAVVTSTGAWGEVLSTALFAAGPGQREQLLKEFGATRVFESGAPE